MSTAASPQKATLLISAQDIFFTPLPVPNATQLIEYDHDHLPPYYSVEGAPKEMTIAGRHFSRLDYGSPVAGLHWSVLATDIRCHAVTFVFTSRDRAVIDEAVSSLQNMSATSSADDPVCVAGYAGGAKVLTRVDPQLADRRLASIPVRIVIDRKGRVRHVHVLRAFPEQAAKITAALMQWQFEPYRRNGEAVEVETGLVFGAQAPHTALATAAKEGKSAE